MYVHCPNFEPENKWQKCVGLCVEHVIWKGRRILKLVSNVEKFLYFLCLLLDQKKDKILCNFDNEISQHFLNLESDPKCVSQHIKKGNNKNRFACKTAISKTATL